MAPCAAILFFLFSAFLLAAQVSAEALPSPEADDPVSLFSPESLPALAPSQSEEVTSGSTLHFSDVTSAVGIRQRVTAQFGGATIADIDGDGYYDFILTYHNILPMRVYFGNAAGNFTRSRWSLRADIHGVSVAQRTARSRDRVMAVSVGGGNGNNLRTPYMYIVRPDRTLRDITNKFGLGVAASRGRVPVFMDMSLMSRMERRMNHGGPDVLFVNLIGNDPNLKHFAYKNVRGNYSIRDVPGFSHINEERAIVTDIDGDGVMEIVHFSVFRVFQLESPFTFKDVTASVWPDPRASTLSRSISAVVELDFNNDGMMDLYLARANSFLVTPRGPPSVPEFADILLKNVGGRYVDVSRSAGIPRNTNSMAVSAGDFDNNGYVDIIITTFSGPDILLLNEGNGTFTRMDPHTHKPRKARGASVMAMDYDLDGAVDYIVGHGLRKQFFGNFRLMKNHMALTGASNYLLVRVGTEPTRACTSLNALVTVFIGRNQKLVRRVGGRGAQAGGQSYLDTVHFGVGRVTVIQRVTVQWTTGAFEGRTQVPANQKIQFGKDL